jgi:Flp pilus assembly protein TadG
MGAGRFRSFIKRTGRRIGETPEKGASLVEFAIILPILMALLFGIVTGGLALNSKNSLNNAAREGARYGATLPVDATMNAFLDDVADVAIRSGTGELDNGVPGRTVCVAYVFPAGSLSTDQTAAVNIDSAGVRTYSATTCFADGRPNDERRVQVRVTRDVDFFALIFSRIVTLDEESVSRYERLQ